MTPDTSGILMSRIALHKYGIPMARTESMKKFHILINPLNA